MAPHTAHTDLESLVARLVASDDAEERARLLREAVDPRHARDIAERLKEEADRARYQDAALALRWCDDIVTLGTLAGAPTVVALGRMVEALLRYDQGRYRDSLTIFDEASALFRTHGDEVGWARAQIGRTGPCMALTRFEEALERAEEARLILEQAGEYLRAASVDHNIAALLEHMNRPAEALAYSERALSAYRDAGSRYYATHTLANHASFLWRLGRVGEALAAHEEARQEFIALGAVADAAREHANIGTVHLAMGHYAEAVSTLIAARRDLLASESHRAAIAGLYLAECFVRLGRFHEAATLASDICGEFAQLGDPVQHMHALVWQALAYAGRREHERALDTLNSAAALVDADDTLIVHRSILDLYRAQLLIQQDRATEARQQLERAIPLLSEAGLAIEAAIAQVTWGSTLADEDRAPEIKAVVAEALAVAKRERLDWLAAQALHLRGRMEMRHGDTATAWATLSTAVRHLDRVHRRMAWDDRVSFGDTAAPLYGDAVGLALQQGRAAVALHYTERSKARALADHLRGHVDARPRARDDGSRALADELEELRGRYAWLDAARRVERERQAPMAAMRWVNDPTRTAEASMIEKRMAAIWRELQAGNPAYRGEAAALDATEDDASAEDDDAAAQQWAGRVQAAMGSHDRVALLEYTAAGDDLVLFVLRAGTVHAIRLAGAGAVVRRLVPLLRLNVERSAAAIITGRRAMPALAANARGVLQRLSAALLEPAAALLDGASHLVIVPHGASHHVPFHALHDGRAYLVENTAVSYAPCASLLEHFAERQRLLRITRQGDRPKVVALSCSDAGALPFVAAEGDAAVAALEGWRLCEEEATLANLRALAGDCDALHLATHAVFRPDEPLFSSLQLYDGQLSTLEVFDLELRCSLVTLSACETALGVSGAGDELMGLSRAFLYAGAPSLVLSLWKVEDRSTAALMDRFYQALGQGVGKAAALRHAQLAVLHNEVDTDTDYSAPYFWAPFGLIGHAGPLMS